ncbi:hypothetical protein O181_015257 [Austropuccinia psidii MF-1]|uniref:Uncharacterized protein n=1 Tax=Austropuccinia psidii MF-1 TaxID=1389203 RepID=A0A9Q3GQL8_9BASI|nr:hypothetical protein [Austropuccinia psidii MF-1]
MGFKPQINFSFSSFTHFTSRDHTDFSPLRIEQNQPNPQQQDSPIPCLHWEQTPQQLTPGPSGTQLLEDLLRGKQTKLHLSYMFDSSELTLPPFVEPSQTNEPPIPGPSPSSKPHEDIPTSCPTPPHSVIIDNTAVRSPTPTPSLHVPPPSLVPISPCSHNEAFQ